MDPFIGEIRMFGGNFAPNQWALCNGAILAQSQNPALCKILGKSFGGNGTSTFGLPNMVDNIPLGAGAGSGLSTYVVGQAVGVQIVSLTSAQMPQHSHAVQGNPNVGDLTTPTAATSIARAGKGSAYVQDQGNAFVAMDPSVLTGFSGNPGPHNNRQPYLAVTFIIALAGVTPK